MLNFFKNLLAGKSCKPRSPSVRDRRVQLNVEAMEERLVPSADYLLKLDGVTGESQHHQPGIVAPLVHSGGMEVVEPEQPVHGYKWRRPRPWEVGAEQGTLKAAPPSFFGSYYHPFKAESTHLISGSADEKLVTLATNGHITVTPPGPGDPSDEGTYVFRAQLEIKEHSTPAPEAQPYVVAFRK
jgi:hypothetical protein